MITDKLILAILSMVLAMIAIVLGFWAYSLSLRTNIRLKYRNIVDGELEELVRREYSQRMVFAMTLFLVVLVTLGIISFLLLLVMKNNIPLS